MSGSRRRGGALRGALLPWEALKADRTGEIGGKATGLVRLRDAGLPVVPGFVVPTSVMRRVSDGRDDVDWQHVSLPESWEQAWRAAGAALGSRLAVRSSAPREDGAVASHAGLFSTELGVTPEELPAAIRRVWASTARDEVQAYTRGARLDMAVLVQPMVTPAVSGVMFTVNPTNGSWREMVVEAVWGLGEPLVAGRVAPHWYLVRRPRRVPRGLTRMMTRTRLWVLQEETPAQTTWTRAVEGQIVEEPTPEHLRASRTLSSDALRRLCRLGLRVERALGAPQDIEWALRDDGRFVLLQARPITTTGAPRRRADVLWTRRFIGERWRDPATPMGWSIVSPELAWFVGYPRTQARYLGGGPPLKLVDGYPYVNATVFRHLVFKLPGASPPSFMLELLPPDEALAWRTRFAGAPDTAVYRSLLRETFAERRWERFAWNPFTNPQVWREFVAQTRGRVQRQVPSGAADLVARVTELREVVRRYVGIHVTSLLFANLSYQWLSSALISCSPEDAQRWMQSLAVSPPGNRTLQTNRGLWSLARVAEASDLDALAEGGPMRPAFEGALATFLAAHGHRAVSSWEVFSPRWRTSPHLLVPLLRAQLGAGVPDPAVRAQEQEARFQEALAEVRARATVAQAAHLSALVHYTRRYLLLRENQRDWFDGLLEQLQHTLLAAGEVLVERDVLAAAEDVVLLTWEEARGLLEDTLDAADVPEWIARRRRGIARSLDAEPPTFLLGDTALPMSADGARLQGLGIGGGRARGPVRVLRSPTEGHRLQPGDVLVTRAVDPSWTPLFMVASAVVTEMGGVLSHGAVVAREYGVPMVVNVDGVVGRVEEGREVTVDGGLGVVWVHP